MRPNQNNNNNNKNRQRGRNNNGGRKHVNPLSRNFESNGPDVKVRGNAAHVAEKYLQLARDAQSLGRPGARRELSAARRALFPHRRGGAAAESGQRDQFGQPQDQDDDDDFPPINDRFASPEPPQRRSGRSRTGRAAAGFDGQEGDENGEPQQQQPRRRRQQSEPAMAEDGQFMASRGAKAAKAAGIAIAIAAAAAAAWARVAPAAIPANAPQPDVGELPAFLTAGGPTTVAE